MKTDAPRGKPHTIHLIGGCNGAGKTTFAREFVPHEVKCMRFLNADEIARGLPAKRLAISTMHDMDSVRRLIGA